MASSLSLFLAVLCTATNVSLRLIWIAVSAPFIALLRLDRKAVEPDADTHPFSPKQCTAFVAVVFPMQVALSLAWLYLCARAPGMHIASPVDIIVTLSGLVLACLAPFLLVAILALCLFWVIHPFTVVSTRVVPWWKTLRAVCGGSTSAALVSLALDVVYRAVVIPVFGIRGVFRASYGVAGDFLGELSASSLERHFGVLDDDGRSSSLDRAATALTTASAMLILGAGVALMQSDMPALGILFLWLLLGLSFTIASVPLAIAWMVASCSVRVLAAGPRSFAGMVRAQWKACRAKTATF